MRSKDELAETLNRKFGWPEKRMGRAGAMLWADTLWRAPVAVEAACDSDDNHVLGCAVAAQAEIIVTGDKDLLVLHPFRAIAVMTPAQFLALRAAAREKGDDA
jgi:hypothetical protein